MPIDPNSLSSTATITFDDEFNTLSLWNGSSGTWATTWWYDSAQGSGDSLPSNGEEEWYVNSNFGPTASLKPWTVDASGVLHLTATKTPANMLQYVNNYSYVSGELNSFHSFSQTYGYFEMKAKLPAGQGVWPAFWLLPEDGSWPPELDVMEMIGSKPGEIVTTVHSTTLGGGATQEAQANPVGDTSAWHTYGVDWEPDFITWYVDGHAVYKVATPADMNKPMYMVANLAIGGHWPGSPDSSANLSADLQIDYIRAYKAGAAPGAAGSSGATTATPSTGATSTGSSSTVAGLTLAAGSLGAVLTGGAGNDLIYASQGNDVLTGGAGSDTFIFQKQPWAPDHITDFVANVDALDLSALFRTYGYTGSDAIADGWIKLYADGAGGTLVRFFDHTPGASIWGNSIINLDHLSPTGLTWASLSGGGAATSAAPAASTPSAIVAGVTLTATSAGQSLTGGAGADTLIGGVGNNTLTGGAGADVFKFNDQPWAPNVVTDFTPGQDKLDLSGLFKAYGYTGSDPIADGWIKLFADGSGGTIIRFFDHTAGASPWGNTIIDLQHVAPAQGSTSDWFVH